MLSVPYIFKIRKLWRVLFRTHDNSHLFVALRTLHQIPSVLSLECVIRVVYYQDFEVVGICCDVFCFVRMITAIYSSAFLVLHTLHHSQSVLLLVCYRSVIFSRFQSCSRMLWLILLRAHDNSHVFVCIPCLAHCPSHSKRSLAGVCLSVRYIVKIPRLFAHVVSVLLCAHDKSHLFLCILYFAHFTLHSKYSLAGMYYLCVILSGFRSCSRALCRVLLRAHDDSHLFVCTSCLAQFTSHSKRSLAGMCYLCIIFSRFEIVRACYDVLCFVRMITPIYSYTFLALCTLHHTQSVLSLGCVNCALYSEDSEVVRACCDVLRFVHMITPNYSYELTLRTLHHTQSALSLECVIRALYCQDSEVGRACCDVFCFVPR